ncbi:3-oxoacyl-ACP synthase III family protein [Sediminibacterium ginsengisoli]|uniref:3-oxoacyl-[acyl-carrier-protein] synthase-3 n=1 Tax=Sediminibacterium ginsengisoli TaxID=413434 RepID=A0A1T4M6Q3_9BACT|nr:ketoacyl-ACP synthase III [Sediminibacterium ginsengisoli]SJZ62458.1 3-oxoacyl-[acyl-carrier-protein] synthase-3 [Sediminibacterium ginsengisoli]
MTQIRTVITGIGSYIPPHIKTNKDFAAQEFYSEDHEQILTPSQEIIEKFRDITGIEERRYAGNEFNTSDMATIAARHAIEDAKIDPETIDQIIVAHNFGNVIKDTIQTDILPSLASRVKHALGIRNPACVAYDILFGCPGWIQGVIHADAFIKAGIAQRCLVVGAEALSRVLDPYDRDSMIFSDGAGATVVEGIDTGESGAGILGSAVQSHCIDEAFYLYMGKSNYPDSDPRVRYIKMKGRKVYEYAIKQVPLAMKSCLDQCGIHVTEVKKFFLHQANEKMDEGFIKVLYKLYGLREVPAEVMPMCIHKLGNSSVATIPTLLDLVKRGILDDHSLNKGDVIMFASVGAGMNINAICYRI